MSSSGGREDASRGASEDLDGGFVDIANSTGAHPVALGPYKVVGLLGGGSMATLYVANKVCPFGYVQRHVIKRVNRSRPDAAMLQEMLLDEARAMAFFDHPNLVALEDVGEDEDGAFIVMEFVDGTDLKRVNGRLRARREALPFELACFMVSEVLRGLSHAHERTDSAGNALEIVHRDVNPSNVLISRSGQVKLTDFGVVRMRERVQAKTEPGLVKGKYAYLAPEYIAGGPCSVRTDLYAAGVMLFELLTGRECYTGKSAYEVMWKIVNQGAPLYRLDREGVPEDLRRIVERATAMEPEQRYRSARDMANALEAWMVRNRRHATSWVLSVFFERHGLQPDVRDRPPPLEPLINLQDALPQDRQSEVSFEAPAMSPVDISTLGSETSSAEHQVPEPSGSGPSVDAPPKDANGWEEPTPTPSATKLEMREDLFSSELTPMPDLDELPVDERIPSRALNDTGHLEPVQSEDDANPFEAELEQPEDASDEETEQELVVVEEDQALPEEPTAVTERAKGPTPSGIDLAQQETADLASRTGTMDLSAAPRQGKLEDHPAVDVIEAYASQGASGVLEFKCGLIWKRVRLDRGRPTGITSNMGMELIGEHLVKGRIITREQLEQALEDSERSARSLTETLLDQGALDRERLEIELGKNLSARLKEVLEWRWGTFEYQDRSVPSASILPRMDLGALLQAARDRRQESNPSGRDQESSDALNPHRRLKEALQVARSIADSSGKGRVDRPFASRGKPSE